ncbi:snurportin-1 isoform X2 [Rhodnius prolixus]|uniref:snurportin-1 isoform X2 n=1 Tax=Rhodnius prolixus TaxID=13249 RepID=UPI003D187B64
MEELVESLSNSVCVSAEETDVFLLHPRYAQYKAKHSNSSQEERRRQWLQNQKEKRLKLFNIHRGIGNIGKVVEKMEFEISKKHSKKTFYKGVPSYKDWIMLSEWLVDIPENFQEEWTCTICPEGKRVLVVAEKGSTCAYSRRGDFLMKFPSALPGGYGKGSNGCTVVDCIWHYPTKTFYLLDVLIWGVPLTDCEAEMRFFWICNKFVELPALMERSPTNRHRILLLHHEPISQLRQMLSVHPAFENNFPKVDGILFYHKESLYTGGKSPLVTWLKPFMIPHFLGIEVAEPYLLEKPLNYPEKPISEVGNKQMETEISNVQLTNKDCSSNKKTNHKENESIKMS